MRERSATLSAAGWRIVLLASLGGTLEFYDFVVFGIFAKDIADAFFPSTSAIVSLMASFGAFATGYLARPIGGIVLSHYGDRYGRRRVFLWSVFVMSGATLGMGLVPPHARWGAVASATIVLLRLIQGFCLGGVLSFILRQSLEESPEFARMRALAVRQPFRELLRTHAVQVVVGCALLAATACFTGLFFSHLPAYLTTVLRYDPRDAIQAQTIGVMAHATGILVVGWIGDRVAPRYLLRAGALLLLAFSYSFYRGLETRAISPTLILVLAGACGGLTNGSFAVLLTDLFPTRIRFSGVALVFNVSFTIFSGMSPLLATTLIRQTGAPSAPAILIAGGALLALAGSLAAPRYGGNVLGRA